VTIRPAAAGDVEALVELWGGARSAHAVTADTPERVAAAVAAGAVLVAEAEGALVGAVIAGFDGWRGNFYRLAVAPEFRRRGIARALVEAGSERLLALGAPRATALVAFDDDAARGFWRSVGFEADSAMGRMVRTL
jgi:ribosomal protein S18 acetylase RimI-like enzyme